MFVRISRLPDMSWAVGVVGGLFHLSRTGEKNGTFKAEKSWQRKQWLFQQSELPSVSFQYKFTLTWTLLFTYISLYGQSNFFKYHFNQPFFFEGVLNGSLSSVSSHELGSTVIAEALRR